MSVHEWKHAFDGSDLLFLFCGKKYLPISSLNKDNIYYCFNCGERLICEHKHIKTVSYEFMSNPLTICLDCGCRL